VIGYNVPVQVAAQGWGEALGPYGPPFRDPDLQQVFVAESAKLESSSMFITKGTAQDLVAAVINSGLAAGYSMVPEVEDKVRAAARVGVARMFLGGAAVVALGLSAWALAKSGRR